MASPLKPGFHRAMMAQESGPPRGAEGGGKPLWRRRFCQVAPRSCPRPSPPSHFYILPSRGGPWRLCVFRVRLKGFKSEMKSPLITDLTPTDHYSMLELPADRPRPPVPSFRGATRALRLPAAVTASLRQVAGREGVSLDVLLLAGLAALLARYSGAEDLVIGAAGPTSLLPLRIQWTGDPSFKQLVAAADGALSAALANADLPFEAPAGEPGSDDPARGLPFQVLFTGTGAEGPERLPAGERKLAVDLALSARRSRVEKGSRGSSSRSTTLSTFSTLRPRRASSRTTRRSWPVPWRRRSCRSRACRSSASPSATRCSPSGTTRRQPSRAARSTSSSRSRRRRGRTRWRWSGTGGRSPMASSTVRRAASPAGCGGWGWGRSRAWPSTWSARRRWWRRSWAFSRRAAPTCRSTSPIRGSAWSSCWRTRRRWRSSARPARWRRCPARRRSSRSTSSPSIRRRPGTSPAGSAPASSPTSRRRRWSIGWPASTVRTTATRGP